MLAYVLAWVVGLGSLGIYLAAFFFPEIHRKNDFIWSCIGLFYALVLWVYAKRVTGGLLLGQTASVSLLCWLGWQTLTLRRQLTPLEQQTQLPGGETVGAKLTGLKSSLQQQLTKLPRPRPKSAPATTAPVTSPIQSSESPAETLVEAPEAGIEETTEAADDVVVEAMNEAIAPPEPVELEETEPAVAEVSPSAEEATENIAAIPSNIPVSETPEEDQTKPKVIIQPRRQPKLPNLPPIPVDLSNLQEQASKLVANTKEKVQDLLKLISKPQAKAEKASQPPKPAAPAEVESEQTIPSAPAPETETVNDALETEESLMSPSAEVEMPPPEATADSEEVPTESLVVDSDAAIAEVAETEISIAEVSEEVPEQVVEAQVTESIPTQALDQDQTDIPTLNPEPVTEASLSIEEVAPEADLAPPAEPIASREAVSPDLTLVEEESLESKPKPASAEGPKAEPEAAEDQTDPRLVRPNPPDPDLVDRAGGSPSQEVKPKPEQQPGTEASESPAKPDPSDHSTESP